VGIITCLIGLLKFCGSINIILSFQTPAYALLAHLRQEHPSVTSTMPMVSSLGRRNSLASCQMELCIHIDQTDLFQKALFDTQLEQIGKKDDRGNKSLLSWQPRQFVFDKVNSIPLV